MTKITIYLRVRGKRHVFSVLPSVSLEVLLERFQSQLGIEDPKRVQSTMVVPLNVSLENVRVQDRSEFIISTPEDIAKENIEYLGSQG